MLKKLSFIFTFILFFSYTILSQDIRFEIDPRIPQDANKQSVMDSELFAKLCLISSGTEDSEIEPLMQKLKDLSIQLQDSFITMQATDIEKQAQYILLFIYEHLLNKYSLTQTRVDTAIQTGIYNCVSATAIFMYFAKTVNIQVNAVETPLHCFCTISTETGSIDVETTNPYGVNPGIKKNLSKDSNQTKYAIVPAKNYSKRQNVDDRRFIAIIYNNRISLLQKQKKDSETVGLSLDALMIQDFNETALTDFHHCVINTANNYTKENYEQGIQIVENAIKLFGSTSEYQQYYDYTIGNLINDAASKKNYELAFSFLERYKNQMSQKKYNEFLGMVTYNYLNTSIEQNSFSVSYENIKAQKNALSDKNYTNLLVYTYSLEAQRLSEQSLYSEIDELLNKGLQDLPNNKTLLNQKKAYQKNYCIEIHNQAVQLINEENYEQAKKIITEALEKVGKNSMLEKDLKMLQ